MNLYIHVTFLLVLTLALKESQVGVNDWSRLNVGQLRDIQFYNLKTSKKGPTISVRKTNVLFFQSELNMIGHMNKKTGEIETRQIIREGQKILQSNDKMLALWTDQKQVVLYDKETMIRGADNRVMKEEIAEANSYVEIGDKIYISDSRSIIQLDKNTKVLSPLSIISMPEDTICLKAFSMMQTLHAFSWLKTSKQLCINQISGGGLIEKQCLNIADVSSLEYFKNRKDGLYFGINELHFYFHSEHSFMELEAKPVQFNSMGALLENMKTFNEKIRKIENKILLPTSKQAVTVSVEHIMDQLVFHQIQGTLERKKIGTVKVNQQKLKRAWVNFVSQTETQLIIQFTDLQLAFYALRSGWIELSKTWNRQQSLAYVDRVLFMKYHGFEDRLDNSYHRKMNSPQFIAKSFTQKIAQFPTNFLLRVQTQINDLILFLQETVLALPQLVQSLTETNFLDVNSFMDLWKAKMPTNQQKKYGLQKYMISITKLNTMFAIDTKTSTILWKKHIPQQLKTVGLVKLKQEYQRQVAILVSYSSENALIQEVKENAQMVLLSEIKVSHQPTIHKINPHSLIIKANNQLKQFDINEKLVGDQLQYNFYQVNGNSILGWKKVGSTLTQTWTFILPSNQKLVKVSSSYNGQTKSLLPIPNDKRVIFKNVDFSNLAILSLQEQENTKSNKLHLFLVNGLTGNVEFSQYQTGIAADLPIDLVYDEHNAIVSYYNTKNRVYEIWSIEAFQSPAEAQLLTMQYEPVRQRENIIFRSSLHGTVLPIKNIHRLESKEALLRRHLAIITRENKIYMMNRDLITSRRPKYAEPDQNLPEGEFVNSKLPVEEYMLPVMPHFYLNYNVQNAELEKIRFSSSDLESTIFLFTHGVDNFMARISPEKPFDMLSDGFNYLQLIGVLVVVTALALYFRSLASEAKLAKSHLD